jgi:hypothetical protein
MIPKSFLNALMLSAALVGSTALVPSAAVADTPSTHRLQPMWGQIDPLWGQIDPLWGQIDPLWGQIDPLWGQIDPLWGQIDPLWGQIDPLWGQIDPLGGKVGAAWGQIDPLWGQIDPLWGQIDPLWGQIDPLSGKVRSSWGQIDPLTGKVRSSWGQIDPLWGQIDPLSGKLKAAWGQIDPLGGVVNPAWGYIKPNWGQIDPLWGQIDPLGGKVHAAWGQIDPLWGQIDPLWGQIDPLWGQIDPLWGQIDPLWGQIDPLWGQIDPLSSRLDPFWGQIDPLWGQIDPLWGQIDPLRAVVAPFWTAEGTKWGNLNKLWFQLQLSNATNYAPLQQQLKGFLNTAQNFWSTSIKKQSGKSFADIANPILSKYGINPDDPASLAGVSPLARAQFFLNFYDGMMGYTGLPRVDWWMGAVNWTPLITQIENPGTHAVIGQLDSYYTDKSTNVAHLTFVGGYDYYVNDHGAAVASLLASQHTAGNVMGIAPNSPVLLYNPFDYTGTASWDDVTAGIQTLVSRGATVVNASLGVPGQVLSDEWAQIMTSPGLNQAKFVLVKAAGNEGVAQTTDINWIGNKAPNNIIIVGSVGPTGQISYFSNTPGNACILINGVCQEQNKLMYRFIVAPGENILASDNNGGVTRVSGTSFAAPLVSGAVALLQDRWPWLRQYPDETTQIIFRSAKDLGAPGVDPIYGWGELDIEASQSPLSFDNLTILKPGTLPGGAYSPTMSATTLKAAVLDPGQLRLWQKKGAYIIAFENIGATFRDFAIPLSSLLTGKNVGLDGENKPFQTYLYQRLIDWANSPGAVGFNTLSNKYVSDDWSLSLTATQSSPEEQQHSSAPIHYEFAAVNRSTGFGLRFGEGSAAHAFDMGGFTMRSDFDPVTGGVNPVLGFASGGAYGRAEMQLGGARFSFGYTQKRDDHMYLDPKYGPVLDEKLAPNRASAALFAVDYELSKVVRLNATFTNLHEADGFLGAQGAGMFNMMQGSSTMATTFGATFDLADGWKLLGSATVAQSAAPQFDNTSLAFTTPRLNSTAFELVAMKSGLFDKLDSFRVSLAQPLHLEGGALQYKSLQVVDRQTGELGGFSQTWSVSGNREYRMEAVYGLPIMGGSGQLDGYALVDLNPPTKSGASELALGGRIKFDLN